MKKTLFTVKQVGQACGLSRMTILRLEERGLLTPAAVQNGRRYYDNDNVSRIMRIKMFSDMGMSYDDILLYYQSGGSSRELLAHMEERYLAFKRAYEEIKLRLDRKEQSTYEFVTLPESVCYCREFLGTNLEDRYRALYQTHQEAVEKGYRLSAAQPMFLINQRADILEGDLTWQECKFICCVPLDPAEVPEEAVVIPGCRGFSCLRYGDYSDLPLHAKEFRDKVRELGLNPIGHIRTMALVAPYTGKDIEESNYVTRYVLPIEDEREQG